jgi:Tol biopolymer transport system component
MNGISELKESTTWRLAAVLLLALPTAGCSDSAAPPPPPGDLSDSWILFSGLSVANGATGLKVHAILPDGRGLRVVTSGGPVGSGGPAGWQAMNPSWSRDGNQIAYVTQPATFETWVMRTDQSESHKISDVSICATPLSLSWSPTGDRIIGNCSGQPSTTHQYVITVADGTNYSLDQLWGRLANSPDWSPIDDRILYVTGFPFGGPNDIHVANLDGSGDALVLAGATGPKWSPDATRIAFMRNYAIFVANADGSGAKQVSFPPSSFDDSSPAWSHDGTQIVFTRSSSVPTYVLHVINADGGGDTRITPDSLWASGASW